MHSLHSYLKSVFLLSFFPVILNLVTAGLEYLPRLPVPLAFPLSLFLYSVREKLFLKPILVLLLTVIFVFGVFSLSKSLIHPRLFDISSIKRNLDVQYSLSRPSIWIQQLSEAYKYPLFLFFGYGKAVIFNGVGESHSQYVRNFVETGIFGIFIFLFLLYSIIKKSLNSFFKNKDPLLIGVAAGLLCSTITMMTISVFSEGFIVVKINEAYWFFAALTFAVISLDSKTIL